MSAARTDSIWPLDVLRQGKGRFRHDGQGRSRRLRQHGLRHADGLAEIGPAQLRRNAGGRAGRGTAAAGRRARGGDRRKVERSRFRAAAGARRAGGEAANHPGGDCRLSPLRRWPDHLPLGRCRNRHRRARGSPRRSDADHALHAEHAGGDRQGHDGRLFHQPRVGGCEGVRHRPAAGERRGGHDRQRGADGRGDRGVGLRPRLCLPFHRMPGGGGGSGR